MMSNEFNRREVLGGIGSAAVLASLYGSGTVAAEETQEHGLSNSSIDADTFVTTADPGPIAQSEAPIIANESAPTTSQVSVSESTETAITVGVPESGSVLPGETINIWAGVVDTNGTPAGIEDEELTIEITRPDSETDEFAEVTDENGSIQITYTVPDGVVGDYEATVAETDAFDATVDFRVGPVLEATTNRFRGRPALTGSETTFKFLLREGQSPITNEEVTIAILEDDSEIEQLTVETDENGFATITDTPEVIGSRTIEATATVDGMDLFDSINYPVSDIGYEYDFFDLDPVLAGRDVAQGGRIWDGDGPVSNTGLEVTYTNDDAGVEISETATTDDNGFFAIVFEVPTEVDSLDVDVETADGRSAALGTFEDSVRVTEPDTEDDDDEPEITASFDEFRVGQGETATLDITATDANDDPVAGETVTVIARYGWDGSGAPLRLTTTDTNADGEATLGIDVPDNAPDNARLNATVVLDWDETQLTADDSVSIQAKTIAGTVNFGDELGFELDVTDSATGDPVSGVNYYVDVQYISGRTGSVAAEGLVSDADGTDTATAPAPDDLSFIFAQNHLSKYDSAGGFSISRAPYPGNPSASLDGAADPGSEINIDYDVAADAVSGLLYGSVGDVTVAKTFDTASESLSITVPEDIFDDRLRVRVWGVGSDGNLYGGFESVSVNPDGEAEPTGELIVSEFEPETITLEAGDPIELSATITNVGDATATQTIEVLLDDTVQETEEIELGVDGVEEVTYELDTSELAPGDYVSEITTDDDTVSGSVTVLGTDEHESGVNEDVFDAVDQSGDGDVSLGELQDAVDDWSTDQQIDGIDASLDDLRSIVDWWAS